MGVQVGTVLPKQSFRITRKDLVRYAGASGDFNEIHWNERHATSVGLPNVIAHGMLTMATAARVVTDWVGDPGKVVSYGVRFSAPIVVPDDEAGETVDVEGVVESVDGGTATVGLTVTVGGNKVLMGAKAVVRV